jgi:hypothetical protein
MNDPPKNKDRELIDMLIAISIVSRHLARKFEMKILSQKKDPLGFERVGMTIQPIPFLERGTCDEKTGCGSTSQPD